MFKKVALIVAALALFCPLLTSAAVCPSLTLGSTGASVTALQQILYNSYSNFPTPSGYFGSVTQAALKQWQSDHGITPTGTVGPLTGAAMKICNLVPATTVTVPPIGAPSSASTTRTLIRGLSGADVAALQQFLILQNLLAPGSASGYFGALTEAAVQTYQSTHGIVSGGTPSTTGYGAVGAKTRAVMEAAPSVSVPIRLLHDTPPPPPINSPTSTLSGQSSTSSTLKTIGFSCTWNDQVVPSGSSVVAYQALSVRFGQTCASQTRVCTDGVLSGSYEASTCEVAAAASCSFNGQSIADGGTVRAYESPAVGFGNQCVSETRTCTNGALDGSFPSVSCVAAPNPPTSCTWNNTTVASGASITGYQYGSVTFGQTCNPQTRTCVNGVLSGYYSFSSCTVSNAASCSFNGRTIADGDSVPAYQASYVPTGSQCVSEKRTCANGSLSGSYTGASCWIATNSK